MWWALGTHLDPNILFLSNPNIRSDREFLYEILGVVIEAGATTVNIADTVGIVMPLELGKLIVDIKDNTPGIANVIISTHCHNDLGLATANTIEGARTGARQLEVTINGIGERAGNASLEEVYAIGHNLVLTGKTAFHHDFSKHSKMVLNPTSWKVKTFQDDS
ncbi:hypothetical protein JHK87_031020 [Glycine soja]|nr:hypothetical protein JHK87_031020 [Glycine soja]